MWHVNRHAEGQGYGARLEGSNRASGPLSDDRLRGSSALLGPRTAVEGGRRSVHPTMTLP